MVNLLEHTTTTTRPATLVEMLQRRALQQPERRVFTFLVDGETREAHLNFAQLDRRARAIAVRLQALCSAGERAILLLPTGLEYVAAFYGCHYAGVVAVPAYPPDPMQLDKSVAGLRAVLLDAQARVVLTVESVAALVQPQLAAMDDLQAVQWLPIDDPCEALAGEWQPPVVSGDSLALLQYTSGSTAAPKGVMLTHDNILHNQAMIQTGCQHSELSTWVNWLPLQHNLGLMTSIVQPVYVGSLSVLMAPAAFLQKPYRWLAAISRFRGRGSAGPNFCYNLCVREIGAQERAGLDLESWDLAIVGGEPIQCDVLERFSTAFAACGFRPETFVPGYGMAESVLMVAVGRKSEPPRIKALDKLALEEGRACDAAPERSEAVMVAGFDLFEAEQTIAVVHPETLERCCPGEIGEVWVASRSIARAYWQRPQASEATFGASLTDTEAGPFLRTGDLGFIADGHVFLTGRCKELIIISGRNHYPQDIELTVQKSHPALRPNSCAAFSVEGDGEERLVVAAELTEPEAADPLPTRTIAAAIVRTVAEQHGLRPTVVLLRPGTLAKTSIGKIQRLGVRAEYLAGALQLWDGQPTA